MDGEKKNEQQQQEEEELVREKEATSKLWEEAQHSLLGTTGAFRLGDGRCVHLACAKEGTFSGVDQRTNGQRVAPHLGSVDEFSERHEHAPALVKQLRNKVRKCEGCGKPNAFTLPACNGCGRDLTTTPISFTPNVFAGFIYGIEKGPFPLTVSLRYEDPECLVFDDLLALSPCHLNSLPATAYIPDWRYLLKRPAEGLALIDLLFRRCWQVVEEQFHGNEAWRCKFLRGGRDLPVAQLKEHVVAGFNYPPSQYHLHLQFILPPFLPFQYALFLQGLHFTYKRFFPVEYVRAVLQLNEPLPEPESMDIEDVIRHFQGKGVDYDTICSQCYARYGASHEALAQWQRQDFGGLGVVGAGPDRVYRFACSNESDNNVVGLEVASVATGPAAKAIQATDKAALQSYGRPYTSEGKPQGTYYAHAKSSPDSFPDF